MRVEGRAVGALPDSLLSQIIHDLQAFPNETVDFGKPHLRRSLQHVYPLFLVLYTLLVVLGSLGNAAMIAHILRRRLYRDPTNAYIMNIGVCNFIMSLILLPLSVAILLIQNWIFGSFLCYFVPMLQDVPIHATMVTMVFVCVDRYRMVRYPHKARFPPFIAVLATWLLCVCVVLPYAVYRDYIDLQEYLGKQFEGVGICTVNLGDDIAEYIRGLFIVLYALPLAVITFLHVRVSGELKSREAPVTMAVLDSTSRDSQQDVWSLHDAARPSSSGILPESDGCEGRAYHDAHYLPSFLTPTPLTVGGEGGAQTPTLLGGRTPSLHHLDEAELDILREKRNQRYIGSIVTAFALCLCPLMILRPGLGVDLCPRLEPSTQNKNNWTAKQHLKKKESSLERHRTRRINDVEGGALACVVAAGVKEDLPTGRLVWWGADNDVRQHSAPTTPGSNEQGERQPSFSRT